MPILSTEEKKIKRIEGAVSTTVLKEQPGRTSMSEGQSRLAIIDGNVTDVKKVGDELFQKRIFKSFDEEARTILNTEDEITVRHKFTGEPIFEPGFQSESFSSGFAGSGYRINKETADDFSSPNTAYNIEIDNMIVRGTLSVYELLIQQIRATNGAIFVTSAAKVASASGLSASDDVGTITFDDPSGKSLCPFADGDIIMMQRVDPGSTVSQSAAGDASGVVKKLVYLINGSPSGATVTVENAGFNNLSYPVEGDEFVRIGNDGTTANRDGVIYLTSDDSNAPFIDIKSSINAYSEWYGNVPKVRLGNLAGITYDSASLSGYGLYSENVYLTGKMTATSGYIGNGSSGFTINNSYIGNGKASLTDSNSGVYVGTDGISLGASSVFKVTNAGELTATSATITGHITLTNSISSSNISDVSAYTTNQDKQKLSTLVGDSPTGSGLFMTSSYLGYYQNSEWTSYLGSNGDFFLAKDNGAGGTGGLSWDSSEGNLTISGSITVLGGNAETTTGSQTKATAAQVAAISAAAGDATTKADAAEASAEAASLSKATYLSSGVTTIDGGNITADTVTAGAILVNAALIGNLFAEEATIGASGFIQSSNFSAGSAGFKIHGNGTAEFDSVTVRSGSAGWNLQTDGTAFLGNNRVKAHTDGNLSIHGDEDGTTALVFYPGTDDPPDHTGTSWNIFRDDTNDFGISYSGNTKMLFSTDKVEIGSGNKLFLGVGADADTGFRRNSGSLDFYANDSINTKMTLDTSGNISLAGGSISGVEGITFSSAVNNGKGITNVTDTGPCHSNVVYSVASADASNVCVITFNNASWGTVVVEMVIARSTGSTGGTILDVIKGYSGANPTVASTDTQGNDQTAYREWAFSTGSATLKLKSSGTTNTTTAMIKLVSSNRPANSDITVAWS